MSSLPNTEDQVEVDQDKVSQAKVNQSADTPGQLLQQGRDDKGLSLTEVAEHLKLPETTIAALEQDQFDQLPTGTFIRGYYRAYAQFVGLDYVRLTQLYHQVAPDDGYLAPPVKSDPPLQRLHDNKSAQPSFSTKKHSVARWLISLGLLTSTALLAWLYFQPQLTSMLADRETDTELDAVETAIDLPSTIAPAAIRESGITQTVPTNEIDTLVLPPINVQSDTGTETPPAFIVQADTVPTANDQIEDVTQSDPSQNNTNQSNSNQGDRDDITSASSQLPTQAEPSTAVSALATAAAAGSDRLTLTLSGDSWVDVRDADNQQLYYGLAREALQRISLQGSAPFAVRIGNAPAVEMTLNGDVYDFTDRVLSNNSAVLTVQ